MKKIFTLLAFLVVTVNAAAQYTGPCLNVGDQNDVNNYGFKSKPQISGQKGTVEGDRLNVSGYYFNAFVNQGWIDTELTNVQGTTSVGWVENPTGLFKGYKWFFSSGKYSAYNSNSENENKSIAFYITNCSAIDLFLYHNTTANSGQFTITATPLDGSNNVLSASQTLSNNSPYFPSLYGLDRNKSYQILLTIPPLTFFHEISFLSRDLRTYTTKVTDGVNWGTMYLDFPVTIPTDHPSLEVYTVEAATDNCCFLSDPIIGTIPANTGVLLYEPVPDHNEIEFVETSELNLNTVSKGVLRGTVTEGFTVGQALDGQPENSKVLTLGKISDNVGFFIYRKNKSTETLAKYKAYLIHKYSTSTSNENVKGIYISDFDELTGIQSVEIENTESGNWYSLQGVQLNSRPTQRGIYLNNGKKVLVK
jgi:hypothetical protein